MNHLENMAVEQDPDNRRRDNVGKRRRYQSPVLECLGPIRTLTASGSTGGLEKGGSQQNPFKRP
jgi:hypothetical protein